MDYSKLSETIEFTKVSEKENKGEFVISNLYPGYGLTVGNSFRRVLLSSLQGSAITYVKIKGISHEFSTIEGVVEDVIEITLNLKKVRFSMFSDEPEIVSLKYKGEGKATAKDIKTSSNIKIINPDQVIANLSSKTAELDIEFTIEKGLGYSPADTRKDDKLSVGNIAVDAFFSPVISANYKVDNIRVGDRTDYNKITFEIETDGSLSPSEAFSKAGFILKDHFDKITSFLDEPKAKENSKEISDEEESEEKESKKKSSKKEK